MRAVGLALGVEVGVALGAEVGVVAEGIGLSTNFLALAAPADAATRGAAVAVVTTFSSSRCALDCAVAATLGALALENCPTHVPEDGAVVSRRMADDIVTAMEASAVVVEALVAGSGAVAAAARRSAASRRRKS